MSRIRLSLPRSGVRGVRLRLGCAPVRRGVLRPTLPEFKQSGGGSGATASVAGRILGSATGLAGIVVTIWCGLRGWPKDEQRAVFQPTGVTTFVMIALWLGGADMVASDTLMLFVVGLPAVLGGHGLD